MTHKERIQFLIQALELQPHPEGGFFRETYRAKHEINPEALPGSYAGSRNIATSIYFLLTTNAFSSFHMIKQDETWHFYEGSTISLHIISREGLHQEIKIGANPEKEEVFQFTVPGNSWFAAKVRQKDSYALVGCTVAPGFDFNDFTLGKRKELAKLFPLHSDLIEELTRE